MKKPAVILATAILVLSTAPATADPGKEPMTTQPTTTQPTTASPPAATPEVVAILTALENAGREVNSIRCEVRYIEDDTLNLARTEKRGTVMFKRAEPHPMFLVYFEKTFDLVENIRVGGEEWWLFRDRWLWEAKGKSRNIIKREVVEAGRTIDVFDLTESRVPMPFGQSRTEILENFNVKITKPQINDPANCDHLYCVPREGSPLAREYKRLEYYVSRDLHLPVRIIAVSGDGARERTADFVDLTASSLNPDLADDDFKLPPATSGFHVTEEPLESEAAGAD